MRRPILYISSIAVLSAIAVSVLSGSRIRANQNYPLQVVNRTQSFEVIKAERGPSDYSFTLKNISDKTIMAVSISPKQGSGVRTEYLFGEVSDLGVAPGTLYSETYGFIGSEYMDTLEIKAIIFDDGSSEGDPKEVREIEDSRLGTQVQMRRTVKVLDRFLASGSSNWFEFKKDLEAALNTSDDDTVNILKELKPSRRFTKQSLSRDLKSGLDHGRQSAIRRASEVEAMESLDGFQYLKEAYEKILRRCPK